VGPAGPFADRRKGLIQIVAGLLKLGFVMRQVSKLVMNGDYLAGAATGFIAA